MSATKQCPDDLPVKLLPHQAAFIETVLRSNNKRIILLRGDAGIGKSVAVSRLASRLLKEQPAARVLLLGPSTHRSQFVHMLRDEGTPAVNVDRYKFREMLDVVGAGEVWLPGVAFVLSDDFAKQPDISASLATVHWDLIISDEAHGAMRDREELLQRLSTTAQQVILATVPSAVAVGSFPMEDVTVLDWHRDQLVDHEGRPLRMARRPALHEVRFSLGREEAQLSWVVHMLSQTLESGTAQQRVLAKTLIRNLHSSPAALEGTLRRLTLRTEGQEEMDAVSELTDRIPMAAFVENSSIMPDGVRTLASRALAELEVIQVDNKLSVFDALLDRLMRIETSRHICVLTVFLSTLYYLVSEIDARDITSPVLHGGMRREDRNESLRTFESNGGVLVATIGAVHEDLSLPTVTDLVLYDLPTNAVALEEILGCFDRFSRTSQLQIHALAQSDGADSEPLAQLQALLKRTL